MTPQRRPRARGRRAVADAFGGARATQGPPQTHVDTSGGGGAPQPRAQRPIVRGRSRGRP